MKINYLNINTFEVTSLETFETTKLENFDRVMAHLLKSSNTTYVYGLDKLGLAFSNYFLTNDYEFVAIKSGKDKLSSLQFQVCSFHGSEAVYMIKARKNAKVQLYVKDAKKIFGRATEEEIAASVGEEDINTGMALAIGELLEQGHTKLTISSNSFHNLKVRCFAADQPQYADIAFRKQFPLLEEEVHKMGLDSLQGGLCYLNNKYKNVTIENGLTIDQNSMYPSIMESEFLPYGTPVAFEGKFIPERHYGFYIQNIKIGHLKLKKDGIPCIKRREDFKKFNTGCYTDEANVELTLTNIDIQLLFENYDVTNIEYLNGYKFKAKKQMFKNFIDFWKEEKIQGQQSNDSFRVMIAKMFLNSSFGKFGIKCESPSSKYKLNRKGNAVKTIDIDSLERDNSESTIYSPLASFVTAYGRQRLIAAIKSNRDKFVYSDTDSCHFNVSSLDELDLNEIKIHDKEFGAWKVETVWTKAKFLGKKQYVLEKEDGSLKIVCAGMPIEALEQLDKFEDFAFGNEFEIQVVQYTLSAVPTTIVSKYVLKDEEIL